MAGSIITYRIALRLLIVCILVAASLLDTFSLLRFSKKPLLVDELSGWADRPLLLQRRKQLLKVWKHQILSAFVDDDSRQNNFGVECREDQRELQEEGKQPAGVDFHLLQWYLLSETLTCCYHMKEGLRRKLIINHLLEDEFTLHEKLEIVGEYFGHEWKGRLTRSVRCLLITIYMINREFIDEQ